MADLSIRKVLEQVQSGQLRIPAFQRGFVWDADRVAYLMDSIHKGYPFGALILWRTKEKLNTERHLGPFSLSEREDDFPVDYVLDGQQRLTSMFGVFQTELVPDPSSDVAWMDIYYDFDAEKDLQESQFAALSPDEVTLNRHFPIGVLFDVAGYRAATAGLSQERQEEIDKVQSIFKEATIPVQMLETDNRDKVAIVFERVNRLGMELDIFQLLAAWTWSEEFDLQQRFEDLAEELKPFGFAAVGEDSNLLLRCCAAIIGGDATSSGLLNLNGAQVRDRFEEITSGIKGAVDFLRLNLHVEKLENLPYPTLLVPLSVFFAAKDSRSVTVSSVQRAELLRWFWRACFSRRFSAGVLRNLNRDVQEVVKLRSGQTSTLSEIQWSLGRDFFVDNRFTLSSVTTKTFILLLAQSQPLSFISGSPVSIGDVLRKYNRKEFHHLYPQSYLKAQDFSPAQINCLANLAIISASDNKTLGGVAPSKYRHHMDESEMVKILTAAIATDSLFEDDYEKFLQERSEELRAVGQRLAQ